MENEAIVDLLKQKINEISQTFEVDVLNIEADKDHFHMIFKTKPTLDIPKYLNAIKTITSREIKRLTLIELGLERPKTTPAEMGALRSNTQLPSLMQEAPCES